MVVGGEVELAGGGGGERRRGGGGGGQRGSGSGGSGLTMIKKYVLRGNTVGSGGRT